MHNCTTAEKSNKVKKDKRHIRSRHSSARAYKSEKTNRSKNTEHRFNELIHDTKNEISIATQYLFIVPSRKNNNQTKYDRGIVQHRRNRAEC